MKLESVLNDYSLKGILGLMSLSQIIYLTDGKRYQQPQREGIWSVVCGWLSSLTHHPPPPQSLELRADSIISSGHTFSFVLFYSS